ncbi:unnamed protein product [Meganyctiphanes norvegica]|uniref:Uncharacterized protein n=1 Tax=Meganyctiphanes norvegica TaxID=48144 RepID=A0AAV2QUV8_MEGNR
MWNKVSDKFILGTLYTSNQNSKYYFPEFFDNLSLDISNIKGDCDLSIMLLGDFDSGTGTLNEIYSLKNNDDVLDGSILQNPDNFNTLKRLNIPVTRSNFDLKIIDSGRHIIEMCKCFELCIVNDRIGTDKNICSTTCADKSMIDYVICNP